MSRSVWEASGGRSRTLTVPPSNAAGAVMSGLVAGPWLTGALMDSAHPATTRASSPRMSRRRSGRGPVRGPSGMRLVGTWLVGAWLDDDLETAPTRGALERLGAPREGQPVGDEPVE